MQVDPVDTMAARDQRPRRAGRRKSRSAPAGTGTTAVARRRSPFGCRSRGARSVHARLATPDRTPRGCRGRRQRCRPSPSRFEQVDRLPVAEPACAGRARRSTTGRARSTAGTGCAGRTPRSRPAWSARALGAAGMEAEGVGDDERVGRHRDCARRRQAHLGELGRRDGADQPARRGGRRCRAGGWRRCSSAAPNRGAAASGGASPARRRTASRPARHR